MAGILDDIFGFLEPIAGDNLADGEIPTGGSIPSGVVDPTVGGGTTLLGGLAQWAKDNPQIAGALFGASGPLAGLLGSLASGGVTGQTAGHTNVSGSNTNYSNSVGTNYNNTNQSGFQNNTNQQNTNQTGNTTNNQNTQGTYGGFQNTTNMPIVDPSAQGAMDRLTRMFDQGGPEAQGAYSYALGMLKDLASGQMNDIKSGAGGGPIGAPNTSPTPAPVTGFPTQLPTAYNASIGNLIKQAFGSFVGDLGSQAITNARNRGFAGGADLLGSAAAPMMGQSLAQVPAMEAKAYLDHVLQAYGLESENAGRKASAEAGALNAATNALGPGVQKYGLDVQKYGIDRTQDNNRIAAMNSLLNSLMGPQRDLIQGNIGLLNAAPRGSQSNTVSGGQSNQNVSGTTTSNQNTNTSGGSQSISGSQTNQQGGSASSQQGGGTTNTNTNTGGSSSIPIGQVLGQGGANIIGGAGTGAVAGGPPSNNVSLLDFLKALQRKA